MPIALEQRFTVRPPVEDDIRAIIELEMALDLLHYGVVDEYAPEDILDDWSHLNRETDAWAVVALDGRLAAYATVTDHGFGRIEADGYVHPDFQGQGIGTELVRLMETRARDFIANAPADARVVLNNAVLQSDLPAQNILESAGYVLTRAFWRMAIDLTEPPPTPEWPAGVTVRTLTLNQDDRAVFDTVEEAFQDHWGFVPHNFDEWLERTKRESFDPSFWFLAVDGAEIAGVALCRLRPEGSAWVNTVAVRRPWRKRGLGLALLHHAFGEFYRRGALHAALGVDAQSLTGATKLYERAGMHVSLRIAVYQKEVRAGVDLSTQKLEE